MLSFQRFGRVRYLLENLVHCIDREYYMSAHVLLNLLNELRKRDKTLSKPRILSLFPNLFNKFNNTGQSGAQMLDSIYHMKQKFL